MLEEAKPVLESTGARVVVMRSLMSPMNEVVYGGLRSAIETLLGTSISQVNGNTLGGSSEIVGTLRKLASSQLATDDAVGENAALQVFSWAAKLFVETSPERRGVLIVDDVDELDSCSISVFTAFFSAVPIVGFHLLLSSTERPGEVAGPQLFVRELLGLSRDDASKIQGVAGSNHHELPAIAEPLLAQCIARCAKLELATRADASLREVVGLLFSSLPPPQRRTLQILAAIGPTEFPVLLEVANNPREVTQSLIPLSEAGLITSTSTLIRLSHRIFLDVIEQASPAGIWPELHTRALTVWTERNAPVGILAHHAIRGIPDMRSYTLADKHVRSLLAENDDVGAVAFASEVVSCLRTQVMQGDTELAPRAWLSFGRTLAGTLMNLERFDDAAGVLKEILELPEPREVLRALILEQLAIVENHRQRPGLAEQFRREAIRVAEACGANELADRLWQHIPPIKTTARRVLYSRGVRSIASSIPSRKVVLGTTN